MKMNTQELYKMMKTGIYTIALLCISLNVYAQRNMDDKLSAFRIAYITDELELTTDEAQKFWPIFNEWEEERKALRVRPKNSIAEMTEADARAAIQKQQAREKEGIDLKYQYIEKISEVVGYQKALKLMKVDREFKKKMLDELGRRRRKAN